MFNEAMNKELMNKEILSRLLDDDLDDHAMNEALDALLLDSDAQKSWHAMQLLRGAISDEGEKGGHASLTLLDKISASIDNEPVILAPDNLPRPPLGSSEDDTRRKTTRVPAYIALAASVVALLTFINYSPIQDQTQSEIVMSQQSQMQLERELQSMVVQHGEFSGAAALNGLVAYVKVVNGSTAVDGLP